MTGGQTGSNEVTLAQIRAAVEAIDGALGGIASFLAPLKPTLRNELIQLLGDNVQRARAAKESLEKLLADLERREAG